MPKPLKFKLAGHVFIHMQNQLAMSVTEIAEMLGVSKQSIWQHINTANGLCRCGRKRDRNGKETCSACAKIVRKYYEKRIS